MNWIDIKERLPEKQGHYLCYCPTSFYKNYRGVIAEFYEDNNTFYGESCESPLNDVLYWAELPELPKNFTPNTEEYASEKTVCSLPVVRICDEQHKEIIETIKDYGKRKITGCGPL